MFGAFIGDIVGSKYEFNNIKTKTFPLFSQGCDYTDDSIMTVAVAKAIMLSRTEQFEKKGEGRGFQEFLVEIMQDFGKRYPNPTGAYGGSFAKWLQQQDPKPYGSYGRLYVNSWSRDKTQIIGSCRSKSLRHDFYVWQKRILFLKLEKFCIPKQTRFRTFVLLLQPSMKPFDQGTSMEFRISWNQL